MSIICRPYITLRDGRVIHASDYGKQAFCFEVADVEKTKSTPDDEDFEENHKTK